MGDGRVVSEKVMLPEAMMDEHDELTAWIARAFRAARLLPVKKAKTKTKKKTATKRPAAKKKAKRTKRR